MNETGLTGDQMTNLYDSTIANSLGWYLNSVLTLESTTWSCASATNCTNTDDVVNLQWGASAVTLQPIYTAEPTNPYIKASYSMA